MSIHEIIEKINTDKREIAFSRLKMRFVILLCVLSLMMQIFIIFYIWFWIKV